MSDRVRPTEPDFDWDIPVKVISESLLQQTENRLMCLDLTDLEVEYRGQNELYYYKNKPLFGLGKFKSKSERQGDNIVVTVSRETIRPEDFGDVPYPAPSD
jgi:hypothetical protein